jgi:hypothetical protein
MARRGVAVAPFNTPALLMEATATPYIDNAIRPTIFFEDQRISIIDVLKPDVE